VGNGGADPGVRGLRPSALSVVLSFDARGRVTPLTACPLVGSRGTSTVVLGLDLLTLAYGEKIVHYRTQ
jgi:hypothetical protein